MPEELEHVVPTDLSDMTTRRITIAGSGAYLHRAGQAWLHSDDPACGRAARAVGSFGVHELVSPEVLRKLTAPAPTPGDAIGGVPTVVHTGSGPQREFGDPASITDPVIAAQLNERYRLTRVSWKVWVGPDRLPLRAHLTLTGPEDGDSVIEADFTGWGAEVLVDPPPPDQVRKAGACLPS
ncbi:hypothetical protein [Nonomuraea sp. NPDC048826]|uniref:hypothetical protein n=1 Tax=Nonomuraea sp. NPDC048826 TaxID=3364347 RepID=UPI0037176CAE